MKMSINQSDLASVKMTLGVVKGGAATALSRSLNKGVDGVGPEVKSVVQGTHNIKSTVITSQITKVKSSPTNLSAKATVGKGVYGRGRGTAVIDFSGGRQTKKNGYRVMLKKNKGVVNLKDAFVATMKSGHKGVFVRAGYSNLFTGGGAGFATRYSKKQGKVVSASTAAAKKGRMRKEAIKEVFSTSVVDSLSNPTNYAGMQDRVIGRIDAELARQTNLLLSRY